MVSLQSMGNLQRDIINQSEKYRSYADSSTLHGVQDFLMLSVEGTEKHNRYDQMIDSPL